MIHLIHLTTDPIDPAALIAATQARSDGAVVSFLGVVRDYARGKAVLRLEYFAYPPMALKTLRQIAREAEERWSVKVAVVHRVGLLEIGDASVAIAVASPHRADAFSACREVIERIKVDVPIWKKEYYADGAIWVDQQAETVEGEDQEPLNAGAQAGIPA